MKRKESDLIYPHELTEKEFIARNKITIESLKKTDSPISLKHKIDFNLGYIAGFCCARCWDSKETNDFISELWDLTEKI
jgi:hypothetical protein